MPVELLQTPATNPVETVADALPAPAAETLSPADVPKTVGNFATQVANVDPALVMRETDTATIQNQIKEALAKGDCLEFLNNFENRLPGGMERSIMERYEDLRQEPRRDEDNPITPADKVYHSEKYLTDPMGQLMDDYDKVIETSPDIDADQLNALRDNFFALRNADPYSPDCRQARISYVTYAIPVYQGLREMGYTHADLWK